MKNKEVLYIELFSPFEIKVLKIVSRRGKFSYQQIARRLARHSKLPLDANVKVATAVRRINQKCRFHKLPWFLNGVGSGRAGRMIWYDKG